MENGIVLRCKIVPGRHWKPVVVCMISALAFAGCSAKDTVTTTPYYHVGTPTNRASVQSWELNNEPYYTQPGVNHGDPVPASKPLPSQRGFEPYDQLAATVYTALTTANINARYVAVTAKGHTVIIVGSVDSPADLTEALKIASSVPGVQRVKSDLSVAKP